MASIHGYGRSMEAMGEADWDMHHVRIKLDLEWNNGMYMSNVIIGFAKNCLFTVTQQHRFKVFVALLHN